jgi:DNA polymerase I-like protein with 3'-5' exonuclease and polymerase domains
MEFPNLQDADIICIDCETYDPDLKEKGPGAVRDGYIAGVAIGVRGKEWYFPVAHEGGGNLDKKKVYRWLSEQLSTNIPKCGANLQYDLAFMWSEGIQVSGPFYDIQIAEPLIDEERFSYALETLSQEYLGEGKVEDEMAAYIRQHFGAKPGKEKGFIWKCPAHVVAPYAKSDVRLPIAILDLQLPILEEQGLMDIWSVESRLLPILTRMHLNGVRVDVQYAEQLKVEWTKKLNELEKSFEGINAGSSVQIAAELDKLGISYPRHPPTAAMLKKGITVGNPKLDSKVLATLEDSVPFLSQIRDAKKYRHFLNTFIQGYILNSHVNGRVHASFNQLKGDEYGTVTGRTSTAHPNLANIPNPEKDAYFSQKCRGMFLPEFGCEWLRLDLSQMEYRLMVHFASTLVGSGVETALRMYQEDPATDFHEMCAKLTGLSRKQAKNINFGLAYGMGVEKLAASLGLGKAEANIILEQYHLKAPFVKAVSNKAMERAQQRGYIMTIGGRRRRFESWECGKWVDKKERDADPDKWKPRRDKAEAMRLWGAVRRAHTHKAANAVMQGSNADWLKKAMVIGVEDGVTDVLGMYLNTVYDELGLPIRTGDPQHEEAAKHMEWIMCNAYKLNVPVLVSSGRGANWGLAG